MTGLPSDLHHQLDACKIALVTVEEDIRNSIYSTDEERIDLWIRVSAIRKRCLEIFEGTASSAGPLSRAENLEAVSSFDRKITYLFFKTFVISPIIMTSFGEQELHFSGVDVRSVLDYKARLCRKIAPVLAALEASNTEQSLRLHALLPVDVRWNHYRNLSRILTLDDPTGELGRKVFLQEDASIRATTEQKLHAIACDLFPFVDEMFFAAFHGFEVVLSLFLSQHTQTTPWDDNKLFMVAAKRCSATILAFILSRGAPILQENLDFAFVNAAGSGRVDLLDLFEKYGVVCSETIRSQAASCAASQRQISSYIHIIRKDSIVDLEDLSKMILEAIASMEVDALTELLSVPMSHPDDFLRYAFEMSIRTTNVDIVKVLGDYGEERLRDVYDKSFILAAQCGSEEILKFLTQLDGVVSEENHSIAFVEALVAGHLHLLPFFRLCTPLASLHEYDIKQCEPFSLPPQEALTVLFYLVRKLSRDQLKRVFVAACRIADREAMHRFSGLIGPLDVASITEGIHVATEQKNEDVVSFLCSLKPLDGVLGFNQIKRSLLLAIEDDCHAITQLLLRNFTWESDDEFLGLFTDGQQTRNHKVMQALFSYGKGIVNKYAVTCIFLHAAENADMKGLQLLHSAACEISIDDMGRAISRAAFHGHRDVIKYLLSFSTKIPEVFLTAAIVCCAEQDDMENFLKLSGLMRGSFSSCFSKDTIQDMVLLGAKRGRIDVVSFFLRQGVILEEVRQLCIAQVRGLEAEQIRQLLLSQVVAPSPDIADMDRGYMLSTVLAHVKTYPRDYLETVCIEGLPQHVVLGDSKSTRDLGGVTKQFIHTLVAGLIDQRVLTITSEGVAIALEDDTIAFELFGRFCSILYKQNQSRKEPFLTGVVFHKCFFELVKLVLINPSMSFIERQFCCTLAEVLPSHRAAFAYILNSNDKTLRKGCLELMAQLDLEGDPYDCAKKILYDYIRPMQAFCRGVSPSLINTWLYFNASILSLKIQGLAASGERLTAALVPLHADIEIFKEKIEWIKEWIHSASQEDIEAFLLAVTGAKVCHANLKIEVGMTQHEKPFFVLRTCFQRIDIPVHAEISREDFISALRHAIFFEGFNAL